MNIITVFSVIIMLPLIIIFLFRRVALQKKSVPDKLFAEALRNENSGHFVTAIITYERTLNEVKKIRFQGSSLRTKLSNQTASTTTR